MRRFLFFLFALVVTSATHVGATRVLPIFPSILDLFLLVALLYNLGTSPAAGMVGGSLSGLLRDALGGGPYGLHGFANTIVLYAASQIQQRLVIQDPFQVGSLIVLAATLQIAVLTTLRSLLVPGAEIPPPGALVLRLLLFGILGTLAHVLIAKIQRSVESWLERRSKRLEIV